MARADIEAWSQSVDDLTRRPMMFVPSIGYDVFCAFLVGLSVGRDDGVLEAFREWLAGRQPAHKNYGMASMVLAEAGIRELGSTEPRGDLSADEDGDARAALIALLREFLSELAATRSGAHGDGRAS